MAASLSLKWPALTMRSKSSPPEHNCVTIVRRGSPELVARSSCACIPIPCQWSKSALTARYYSPHRTASSLRLARQHQDSVGVLASLHNCAPHWKWNSRASESLSREIAYGPVPGSRGTCSGRRSDNSPGDLYANNSTSDARLWIQDLERNRFASLSLCAPAHGCKPAFADDDPNIVDCREDGRSTPRSAQHALHSPSARLPGVRLARRSASSSAAAVAI